jgi:hypothetical protein
MSIFNDSTGVDVGELVARLETLTYPEILTWVDGEEFVNCVLTPGAMAAIHAMISRRNVARLWQRGDIGGALRLQERYAHE